MARKYLRGLQYSTGTNGRDMAMLMRFCYEFWGYCVNGTNSLTTPGGMPTTPTSAPTNFFEGTTVLATGNDGVTSSLGSTLTSPSATFNTNMIGKYVTIWQPDSTSTDDSIYRIANVISTTQLQLYPFSGGTPDTSTLKNNITSRSNIRYRVIDVVAASQLAIANGNYFVGTLAASDINAGQASSQFQFFLRGSANTYGQFGILGSPAGTWTGSAFTGTTLTERVTTTNSNFTGANAGVLGYITLIADKTFFLGHIKSPNAAGTLSSSFYFCVTVPQRLYTQAQDPNPLTIQVSAATMNVGAPGTADSLTNAFGMVDAGGTTRGYQLLTRNLTGDGQTQGSSFTIGPNLNSLANYQFNRGGVIICEALMSYFGTIGQYSLARAKLRPIAFTGTAISQFQTVGENGEYIHVGNGILWPWDGAILPYNLLPLGV